MKGKGRKEGGFLWKMAILCQRVPSLVLKDHTFAMSVSSWMPGVSESIKDYVYS